MLPAKAADEHVTDGAVFLVHESGWHHAGRNTRFWISVKGQPLWLPSLLSAAPWTGPNQILPAKAVRNCLEQI